MLDEFENGHAQPRTRLREALRRMHEVAVQGGWSEEVPGLATVRIDHIWGVEQAGAEVVTLPTCIRVLVHLRAADGCVPGSDMLHIFLLNEAGQLVDQLRHDVSTRITRYISRSEIPMFMPVIEESDSPAPQMVIRLGLSLVPLWMRSSLTEPPPVHPHLVEEWMEAIREFAQGRYRAVITPDGFQPVEQS